MAQIAIIGAGPTGLIAAETLGGAGHTVTLFDRMASPGRKFLLAGRGGLNLTHSEPRTRFMSRYGNDSGWLSPLISAFSPEDLRAWCEGLGQPAYVGSSGRVFPASFKAAPLLRAWLRRLDALGVRFEGRHRWLGFGTERKLRFSTPDGDVDISADATLLALGGASWPRMGSDGSWVPILRETGIHLRDLRSSNCGVHVAWTTLFAGRFEGTPLKRIEITACGMSSRGEAVVTRWGLEGGAIYALSSRLRDELDRGGTAEVRIDLRPDVPEDVLDRRLAGPRHGRSLANILRQRAGLSPVGSGLVQEALHSGPQPESLGALIKAVPVHVTAVQTIERAISSAGGIIRDEWDDRLMLNRLPGVFVAGEMLDWEAPTGGYLLQACFSTGRWAARGMQTWLQANK
jgi:uncharacterized flavoprotein (TIGR03862 family)